MHKMITTYCHLGNYYVCEKDVVIAMCTKKKDAERIRNALEMQKIRKTLTHSKFFPSRLHIEDLPGNSKVLSFKPLVLPEKDTLNATVPTRNSNAGMRISKTCEGKTHSNKKRKPKAGRK